MNQIERFFRRYILSTAGILILFFFVNVLLLIAFFTMTDIYNNTDSKAFSIEEFARHLSYENGTWNADAQAMDMLESKNAWAMILDDSGQVIWEERLPEDLPRSYTVSDVAVFSKWYLDDHPVRVWTIDGGLLVTGFPPGTLVKQNFSLEIPYVWVLLFSTAAVFFINLFLMLYLFLRNAWRVEKAMKPILNGIRDLSAGKPVGLPENGELAEINASLNHAGKYMLEKDNTRAEWIRGISHDIRTPLSMILGYASEIEDTEDLPSQVRHQAGIIRKQSEKLKQMVADLNLTTRLEYSMQPLHPEQIDPVELARQVITDYLNSGQTDGFSFGFSEDNTGDNISMTGDRTLLVRLLGNLIQNSITHNPEGCHIEISVGVQKERNAKKSNVGSVVFTVSDDGKGMDESQMRRMNNPEKPGSIASDTREHGLGLKIVRQITEAHHGSIYYSAADPHGLTVTVTLPCQAK